MAAEGGLRTRQAAGILNVVKPSAKLKVRSNFFIVWVADSWNNAPGKIKMARSIGQFKQLYKLRQSDCTR